MSRFNIRKFLHMLFTFCLVSMQGIASAEDTEIYFSSGSTSGNTGEVIRPNVLFILDTSGSMTTTIPQAGGKQRITVLKEAMTQLLGDMEDVNVGLMRYTNDDGGPVLFPISYIDGNVADIVGENVDPLSISYETSITDGANDGEQNLTTNAVTLGDTVLEYTEIGASTAIIGQSSNLSFKIDETSRDAVEDDCATDKGDVIGNGNSLSFDPCTVVGLRFDAVTNGSNFRNAKILHAYLDFDIETKKTTSTTVRIYAHNSDDSAGFTTCSNSCDDITSRSLTSTFVTWTGLPASNKNATITSPDIKDVIQAIVSRGCVNPPSATPNTTGCTYGNDDLMLIIKTTAGERVVYSRDGSSSRQPRLRIEYEQGVATAVPGDQQRIGYRFENIRIPQGATLTAASLVLTPSATGGSNNDTEWTIKAEAADNSEAFSNTTGDFTNRTLTTAQARWDVPAFTVGNAVETTDNNGTTDTLKNVLQQVVNRSGWCGGNAISLFVTAATNNTTARRETQSQEGAASTGQAEGDAGSSSAPRLKYSFQSGSTGCYTATESAQVGVEGDDAEQNSSGTVTITDTTLSLGVDTVGVRFQGVDVPQGATILDAEILFTAKNTSSGAAAFTIKGELPSDGNANIFANELNNISSRTFTSSVNWTPTNWITGGELYPTSDLKTIVQSMVNDSNWASGNAMVFVVEPGTGARNAESNNSDPARAPRLLIRYADTAETLYKTVRERLVEIVDDLSASDSTPNTETLYEAALYWRGAAIDFGKTRDGSSSARISHAGSYCKKNSNGTLDCRGATVGTGDGDPNPDIYGVKKSDSCNMSSNPNSSNCSSQAIQGSPKYISPFNSELTCQNNFQVLLTDGANNSSSSGSRTKISTMTGSSCLANNSTFRSSSDSALTYSDDQKCMVDVAKFLATVDQSTATVGDNLANDQLVKTYTIAFNLSDTSTQQLLKDVANAGGNGPDKGAYTAITAGQLVDVFNTILTDVKSDPTSFVSPSLATNAFNRLLSRDEVYFGLFTPALNVAWPGNVKKYNICVDSSTGCALGTFLDANGDLAIDPADDKFKDTSQSIWSNLVDGRATTKGGSGAEITDYTQTVLYTESSQGVTAPSTTPLSTAGYKLTSANWASTELGNFRTAVCPTPSTTAGSDCEKRMLWLLGKNIIADAATDISSTQRWSTNDILHSSPSVITYGGEDSDNDGTPGEPEDSDGQISTFFDKIVVGTNDGTLRMINGADGTEDWRFMPSDFWTQQQTLFTNPQASHVYGLDVTPTLYVKDVDNNGVIETGDGDFVKVFIASRSGGKFLYALDVSANVTSATQKVVPKFLWKIQGGVTSGFSRLSHTWSQPRLADIATTTGVKTVLIFGGGFDMAQESANVFSPADNGNADFKGNAIYIIDPDTGAKILSISGASTGADIQISDMRYSIPSRISIMDSDGDGIEDRLYVGDTGGQIWRVDLGTDIKASGGLDASCLAATPATCTSTIAGRLATLSSTSVAVQKRRFYEPPSIVQVRDATYSNQADYDYILIGSGYRAHPLNTTVEDRFYAIRDRHISGLTDADGDHYSELTDGYADGSGSPITNSGLINATTSVIDTSDATKQSSGWYYDFKAAGNTGEKVLSAATATAGGVTFTTFRPGTTASSNPCEGTLGNANAYNFNILNGNAFLDWDADGDIDKDDRAMELGGGIPSDVVPVFTKEGVVGIVGIEGGASQLGVLSGLPRFRTYWYEE